MHREIFTQRSLDTEKLAHTEAFTQRSLLHRAAFSQRSFCTEELLHREACTLRGFDTEKSFTQRSFCPLKLLHTETFMQRNFYTQKLLHTEVFSQKNFTHTSKEHTNTLYRSFCTEKSLPIFHQVSFFMIMHHLSPSYLRFHALLVSSLRRLVFISHGVLSVHTSSSLPLRRSKLNENPGINSD